MSIQRKLNVAWKATRIGLALEARRRRRRRQEISRRLAAAAPRLMLYAGFGLGVAGLRVLRRARRMNLRGQVALVTGGTRGLGFALADELARQGARVVICARSAQELTVASRELARRGADVLGIQCDVSRPDEVQRMVASALERYGRIDVLINNAGIIIVGPIQNQRLEDFQEAMDIIFWGAFHTTNAVLPQMLDRHAGRIVNITSIGGKVSVPHLLSYSGAKFALVGYSEGLRAELAKDGIRVTTVVPGLMRTGSYVNALFTGQHRKEYTWFSLGDSLPLLSISARRAARQIVAATREGRPELVVSWQAQLLSRLHGLFPGLTTRILTIANRLLPAPASGQPPRYTGRQSETAITRSFLTGLSQFAMRRLNQYPERDAHPTASTDGTGDRHAASGVNGVMTTEA